jgi:hypothetical protein
MILPEFFGCEIDVGVLRFAYQVLNRKCSTAVIFKK